MSGTAERPERDAPSPADVVQLSHLLPALWRGLVRATRAAEQMPAMESQVSILRTLVDVEGGLTPATLADQLHLARATVSNLLKPLEKDGLVSREPSPHDGRSVTVTATGYGRSVLNEFRVGRAEVLTEALESLRSSDLDEIVRALPALARLLEQLDSFAEESIEARRRDAGPGLASTG